MIKIVLGVGFGDEGKGSVVNELINNPEETLIIRFNGGHQVGHTVVQGGIRHVFSNFGSGTLKGVPTYWSKFCTFHPKAILNEFDVLKEKGITPKLYIDPLAMVTTPFDIYTNQSNEQGQKHGSVGVGFGQTIKRNEETPFKLYAQDLSNKDILNHKIDKIMEFYFSLAKSKRLLGIKQEFINEVDELLKNEHILIKRPLLNSYADIIFEGGQGILLDQDFGFFPHVTRSNTTSKNAFEIINDFKLEDTVKIVYVTRAYLTRHGNGPLPFEKDLDYIIKNPNETNVSHQYQGEFRYAPLNIDLLNHAIDCDRIYSGNNTKHLFVTCVDQLCKNILTFSDCEIVEDDKVKTFYIRDLHTKIKNTSIDIRYKSKE